MDASSRSSAHVARSGGETVERHSLDVDRIAQPDDAHAFRTAVEPRQAAGFCIRKSASATRMNFVEFGYTVELRYNGLGYITYSVLQAH